MVFLPSVIVHGFSGFVILAIVLSLIWKYLDLKHGVESFMGFYSLLNM